MGGVCAVSVSVIAVCVWFESVVCVYVRCVYVYVRCVCVTICSGVWCSLLEILATGKRNFTFLGRRIPKCLRWLICTFHLQRETTKSQRHNLC